MMWGWGHGGGDWFAMGIMMFFWVLVIVGVVLLIVWVVRAASGPGDGGYQGRSREPGRDSALEIARERLARGEIDPEEYERIKNALGR